MGPKEEMLWDLAWERGSRGAGPGSMLPRGASEGTGLGLRRLLTKVGVVVIRGRI